MPSKNDRFSSYSFSSSPSSSQLSTPRVFRNWSSRAIDSNEELREKIADLDTKILQLERYLLSLYRTSFGDHLPDDSSLPPWKPYTTKVQNDQVSSVSDTSLSPSFQPLSETDKMKRSESGHPSLADLLGLKTLSPNKLSEELLRVICVIHFKLSDKDHSRLVNNSNNKDINEKCGQELGVIINKLCLDEDNLKSVECLLQNFSSLVQKLEKVDPARMAREEKLAFWINIHNAIVMHAYMVYGIKEDATSTMTLKAAFNIGGERVNAYDVQSSILGIRECHSPSRLRTLFSPARSLKTSSSGHTYALEYAEPLLHFALSTGASTDPMVRVYTAEGIFQELRQARDSFIQTSVGFDERETRILLPKIIYNYAKDTSLDKAELFNTISECLIETQRTKMRSVVKKRQYRCIKWIKHDFNFRYIIHWELMRENLVI